MKPKDENEPLVVAVSSGALFDTRDEEKIVEASGLDAFYLHRRDSINAPFNQGTAFPLVSSLLSLNQSGIDPAVKLYIVSRNHPSICLRVTNSIEHHKLDIQRALFCGEANLLAYLQAANADLFLTRNEEDVVSALKLGIPAAKVYDPPHPGVQDTKTLRIAFDGDSVLFSDEAETVYRQAKIEAQALGLGRHYPVQAFIDHEVLNSETPLPEGPLAPFGKAVTKLQQLARDTGAVKVQVALITARSLPSHERALFSLEYFGINVDLALFLSGEDKAPFVAGFNPHIFFDDQDVHLVNSSKVSPCAIVPPLKSQHILDSSSITNRNESISTSTSTPEKALTPIGGKRNSAGISKADFETNFRLILSDYIPFKSRKSPLPEKYRSLIQEGKQRKPHERKRILDDLEKYRLGDELAGYEPLLNRESDTVPIKLKTLIKESNGSIQSDLFEE